MGAKYERNIRQFRDVVFASIDAAAPLVGSLPEDDKEVIRVLVQAIHIPMTMVESNLWQQQSTKVDRDIDDIIDAKIISLHKTGLGPRKIAAELQKQGYHIEYYRVAYKLTKLKKESVSSN